MLNQDINITIRRGIGGGIEIDSGDPPKEEQVEIANNKERKRDAWGQFTSESNEASVDEFFHSYFKVVWLPNKNGPDHVLVRQTKLHWYQKVWYTVGATSIIAAIIYLL